MVHSFNRLLLSTSFVRVTVLGAENTIQFPLLGILNFSERGRECTNKMSSSKYYGENKMRAAIVKGRVHPCGVFISNLIFLHSSPRGSVPGIRFRHVRTPRLRGGDVIFPGSQLPRGRAAGFKPKSAYITSGWFNLPQEETLQAGFVH